jgi:hypothetical protein
MAIPVVEIYCSAEMLGVLGWPNQNGTQLREIHNIIPRNWDSSRDGDGEQICVYVGDVLTGANILKTGPGNLTAMCQFGLPESYVLQQLWGNVYADDRTEESMETNMILIQRDTQNGKTVSIRGFSLIKITQRPDPAKGFYGKGAKLTQEDIISGNIQIIDHIEMEVLVLGNATPPTVITRARSEGLNEFSKGARTIRAIQLIGANLPRGIGLNALETVITFYYKYGWRFIDGCINHTQSQVAEEAVSNLNNFFIANGVPLDHLSTGKAYDEALTSLLNPFKGRSYNLMGSHASSTEHLAATENYQKTTAAAARDNGYRMLMCQKLNAMHFLANGLALPQEHGTLKMPSKTRGGRRKRTKKRALKKRHRTKRKRRKRRKRTRKRKRKTRRKRGGKHKLSNKKCKMLRHQHSKLIHHVNMVGKALRVQCKKRL